MTLLVETGVLLVAVAVALAISRVHRAFTIPALLLSGLLLGPHAAGVIRPGPFLDTASDLGLTLLLFYTALFARPDVLRRGGRVGLPLAAYDLVLNFAAAFWVGSLFGLDLPTRLLLAGVMATSSTSAILKIMGDEGRLRTREGQILVTLLWIEDIVFIAYFVFLTGHSRFLNAADLPATLTALAAFAGYLVAVRLLRDHIWNLGPLEVKIPLVTALGLLGAGLGHLGGLPMAGAAFTTGLVMTGAKGAKFVGTDAPYLREAAAAVFFIGFGALLDPTVTRDVLPMAATAAIAILMTELLFIPQAARLLGLAARESILIGSSLVARGGKSASFAQLGVNPNNPGTAQIQSVAGILTLALTPIAPLLVRVVLGFRRSATTTTHPRRAHREVVSRLSRGILIPQPWRQRNPARLARRIEFAGWIILPFLLGVYSTLLPYPLRLAPILLGLIIIVPAYQSTRSYLRAVPGAPGTGHGQRGLGVPRLDRFLPAVLFAPITLSLLLPLTAPWAVTAYPILAAVLMLFLLLLPRLFTSRRATPYWQSPQHHPRPASIRPPGIIRARGRIEPT